MKNIKLFVAVTLLLAAQSRPVYADTPGSDADTRIAGVRHDSDSMVEHPDVILFGTGAGMVQDVEIENITEGGAKTFAIPESGKIIQGALRGGGIPVRGQNLPREVPGQICDNNAPHLCNEPAETMPGSGGIAALPSCPFSRGVNLSDWFLTNSVEGIRTDAYTRKDFEDMKSLGIDVVRLPIRFHKMTGKAPGYKLPKEFFEKLDYALDLAEDAGIHIILDFHSYFGGNQFPQGYGEAQTTKAWEHVAGHCKKRSSLVVYELMNEPDGDFMRANWPQMQGRILKAVRKADPYHTIIVGGAYANAAWTLKELPDYGDDNLIYNFHIYDPPLFTHQGQDWSKPSWKEISNVPFPYDPDAMPECPESLRGEQGWYDVPKLFADYPEEGTPDAVTSRIDEAVAFAKERNARLFCGEFGVLMTNVDNGYRCSYYRVVRRHFEKNDIAWAMWDYHNSFGLFRKGAGYTFETDLNVPLLEALGFNIPDSYQNK